MRKYWAMFQSQIQLDAAYSAWYWAGAASSIIFMLTYYSFWHAVYRNTTSIAHMSMTQMITYSVLAMLLGNYVSGVGNTLSASIRNGEIAVELMRPYDLLLKLVAMDLGGKVSATLRNSVPLLVIGFLFLGVRMPVSATAGVEFFVSAILGVLIGTQFDLMVGVLAFWTVNTWGLRVLRTGILSIFSGSLVPLTLFPHWFLIVSKWLPFASMVFTPIAIYTGTVSSSAGWLNIAQQWLWLIGLFVLVRFIWRIALRKVVVFGG